MVQENSSWGYDRIARALAGTDFFTIEVLTWRGLATYCVLFFLHPETLALSFGAQPSGQG
jgi:hypothetical protein